MACDTERLAAAIAEVLTALVRLETRIAALEQALIRRGSA